MFFVPVKLQAQICDDSVSVLDGARMGRALSTAPISCLRPFCAVAWSRDAPRNSCFRPDNSAACAANNASTSRGRSARFGGVLPILIYTKIWTLWESQKDINSNKICHYLTMEGHHVFCTIRQLMPSISIASWARLKLILPPRAAGHTKRLRSRRLVDNHATWPFHQIILI